MIPPPNVKLHDFATSTVWLDEDGIVFSSPKLNAPAATKEESMVYIEKFRELVNNEKACIVVQTNGSDKLPSKEDREWVASELESITKAMAVVYVSPLGRMMANLFFGLKPSKYPVKFFSNQYAAHDWIKQFVDTPVESLLKENTANGTNG